MQVRQRDASLDIRHDVLEESVHFYVCKTPGAGGGFYALPKDRFEPVPEARWVDVTADCLVQPEDSPGRSGLRHCGPGNCVALIYDGYRLEPFYIEMGRRFVAFLVLKRED